MLELDKIIEIEKIKEEIKKKIKNVKSNASIKIHKFDETHLMLEFKINNYIVSTQKVEGVGVSRCIDLYGLKMFLCHIKDKDDDSKLNEYLNRELYYVREKFLKEGYNVFFYKLVPCDKIAIGDIIVVKGIVTEEKKIIKVKNVKCVCGIIYINDVAYGNCYLTKISFI